LGLKTALGPLEGAKKRPPSHFLSIIISGGANINGKKKDSDSKRVNINEYIRATEVRVINDEGTQLGVKSIAQALEAARMAGLDLVEVAPEADPPVCRIMDFGRYKFQQSKKVASRKSSVIEVKEVKFRPKTDEHDYQFKLRNIQKFLAANNKIKVSLMFRGREIAHVHLGQQLMERIIKDVAEFGQPETAPKLEGRSIIMILGPKN
jgi:translation initiation factor IF-3